MIEQLNWVSNQTRPDIAFEACEANVSFKDARVSDLTKANKVIRKLLSDEVILQFSDLGDLKDCKIISYNDSSCKNLPDGGSQGGFIALLLCNPDGKVSHIHWQSRKIRHVVKSILAAECLALEEATETCFWIRSLLTELLRCEHKEIPVECVTDNQSLLETVYSTKTSRISD